MKNTDIYFPLFIKMDITMARILAWRLSLPLTHGLIYIALQRKFKNVTFLCDHMTAYEVENGNHYDDTSEDYCCNAIRLWSSKICLKLVFIGKNTH